MIDWLPYILYENKIFECKGDTYTRLVQTN